MPNGLPTATRKQELGIFFFLTIVLAPVVAVSIVGGYGLVVWLYQTLAGLPGDVTMSLSHHDNESDSDVVHIASFVVQAVASHLPTLSTELMVIDGVEVHASDPCGKLVVTAESNSTGGVADVFDRIRELRGVIAVSLVYHQVEDRALLEQEITP